MFAAACAVVHADYLVTSVFDATCSAVQSASYFGNGCASSNDLQYIYNISCSMNKSTVWPASNYAGTTCASKGGVIYPFSSSSNPALPKIILGACTPMPGTAGVSTLTTCVSGDYPDPSALGPGIITATYSGGSYATTCTPSMLAKIEKKPLDVCILGNLNTCDGASYKIKYYTDDQCRAKVTMETGGKVSTCGKAAYSDETVLCLHPPSPASSTAAASDSSSATGAIIGGVVGAVAFCTILALVIYCCFCAKRKGEAPAAEAPTNFNNPALTAVTTSSDASTK